MYKKKYMANPSPYHAEWRKPFPLTSKMTKMSTLSSLIQHSRKILVREIRKGKEIKAIY